MRTVLKSGGYRLFFYSGDGGEPPHVHVEREDRIGKFWLTPVRWHGVADSLDTKSAEWSGSL
jgi:hypothetical protein